jgi:transcriptional regulator with XRE-family HTH domain
MGQKPRAKPERLALKLQTIRLQLGLTLEQLAERLQDVPGAPGTGLISRYEHGEREPTLLILLAYARLAGVHMEVLVDDELDLPARIPGRKRF